MSMLPDGLQFPILFSFFCIIICTAGLGMYYISWEKNFWEMKLLRYIYKKNTFLSRIFFVLILWISLCFSALISLPYQNNSTKTLIRDGIDIEIVLDLSYSMNAADLTPSRLEVSKKVLENFIWEMKSDRVWIILFSWKPFQSVPLTFDYDFLTDFISEISADTINQNNPSLAGTAIGDALILAADTLEKDTPEREKIIILVTDGEANKGLDPMIALKLLQDKKIKTYTIGVGKDDASYVEVVTPWWFLQRIPVWPVDEETLKKIASATQWEYYRADSWNSFENILENIASLESSEIEFEVISFYTPTFWLVFLLLLIQFGILWYIILYKWIRF